MRVEGGKKKPIRVARSGFVSTDHRKGQNNIHQALSLWRGLGRDGEREQWLRRAHKMDVEDKVD